VELRHLRYFVAVAEELHFRRAAERLYVAQPAVSEQIRKLEAELGVRLFDRTNRSVLLTDSGKALLEQARRVLHQAEVAQLAARNATKQGTLRLRVGYMPHSLPASVPRALQHLSSASPTVDVSLETGSALGLIEALRDRWLDAVVAGLPAPTNGLRATSLGPQHLVAALPVRDPRSTESEVSIERLAPDRLVVLPRDANPALYDAIVSLCRSAGLSTQFVEVAEPSVEAVLLAVSATGAAALLPESVTERYAAPGVRLLELAEPEPAFESAVLTHPDTDNLAVLAFLRTIGRVMERTNRPVTAPRPLLAAA
jgi:DNA-binding transcriptional LysR family regulator